MVQVIDDVTIPDIGTVAHAFTTLNELIGSLPDYAKPVWSPTRERMELARAKLNRSESPTKGRGSTKFLEALTKLVTLLVPYAKQPLAGRVIQHLKLKKKLDEIHRILDVLFKDVAFNESDDWMPALKFDIEQHAAALQQQIDDPDLKDQLARDGGLYLETMTLLQHASNTQDPEQWNPLAVALNEVAKRVVVAPHVRAEAEARIPPWFVPPMNVRYRPNSFAKGSFGAVHHGTWGSGTQVVVKILLDSGRLGSDVMTDFLREANLWYQFTHPYCVRMFGASHISSPPFILCEDATNGNLAEYLARDGETEESNRKTQIWRRLFEAALGLEYLHDKDVVHCDLKLNNMLVGTDGYSRIADFGLSVVKRESKSTATAPSTTTPKKPEVGAIRWRAPECFVRPPSRLSDTYSFGMCIYEAFTGKTPFYYLDDESAQAQIERDALPRPEDFTDDDAWKLIEAMTKKEPAERMLLKDAIVAIKLKAQKELEVEDSKYVLCVQCQTRLRKGFNNFCPKCGMHVGTKPVEEEIIRIGSAKDLARIINLLSIGGDHQKKGCLKALLDYVFGDPQRQEKVRDAGAIPILIKLLNEMMATPAIYPHRGTEKNDVLVDSLLTLGCIYAVNEPMQDTAAFEDAIDVLVKALESVPNVSDDRRRAKAAMAIGLLADSHDANRQRVPPQVVATIQEFANSTTEVLKNAGTRALNHLGPSATGA